MENIENHLSELSEEERKEVLTVLNKYGDNKWWRSEDSVEVARYQLFESRLLVDFSLFREGLEQLLGRPVYTHELGLAVDEIKAEAKEAIKKLEKGESLEQSIQYKNEKTREAINSLANFAHKNGKGMITYDKEGPTLMVPSEYVKEEEELMEKLGDIHYENRLEKELNKDKKFN